MANEDHVALLKQGVAEWNAWRGENPNIRPDLRQANLCGADLGGADLSKAFLSGVDLSGAKLQDADFSQAHLYGAKLRGAFLLHATLPYAELVKAKLSDAHLGGTNLRWAKLSGADLSRACLNGADLREADLGGAHLGEANLRRTDLNGADLSGADLRSATLGGTVFVDTKLEGVIGLGDCHHAGPSSLDFSVMSGPLPLAFLRGVGLPDTLIEYLPSLLNQPIQFYSCFISYSAKDQEFAERLHADLQNKGVRCWFAPHDMLPGDKILDALDEAIRLKDKVLLILSEGAIASDWVEGEVTRALDEERERKQPILFPVRIDDTVLQTSEPWARLLRGQRYIGDFTGWKEHDSYRKSFERVLKGLKIASSASGVVR